MAEEACLNGKLVALKLAEGGDSIISIILKRWDHLLPSLKQAVMMDAVKGRVGNVETHFLSHLLS